MRGFYAFVFILSSLVTYGQVNEGLNPEERAYLFHIVKKSPILDNNFGRYFDYQGPDIRFPNQTINYDSIELLIINNPELLIIRKSEIAKSPKGLIAEAANKMALWELNKTLLAKRKNKDDLKQYKNEYARFEGYLLEKLPPNAMVTIDDRAVPDPKLHNAMNPSLTFNDRDAMLGTLRFLDLNDRLVTHRAISYAINTYVEERAFQIFRALGGEADEFVNVLVAAGDGSSTTGMLEEREKDELGRWSKGLPKAVGLFPYVPYIEKDESKKKPTEEIEPMRHVTKDFHTVGYNRYTNIHFDVWGYNSEKQTTVVIEKNGLNYHLFGSTETRFLSPDSTFSGGTTFQAIINDLEHNKIASINEEVFGRKGIDHWIEYNKKKKDATELKIEKKEKEYSDLGYSPITTSSNPSGKVKRSKRKAVRKSSGSGSFDGTPTTKSNRKTRKQMQSDIVHLYDIFESYKRKIQELEVRKQEALDQMARYQLKLDQYKLLMGYRWASFKEYNGLYIFEDSSTFDIRTQEFQFLPTDSTEAFEVRLIAIPESSLSKSADEVMLHINIMDAKPDYNARVNLDLVDVFDSDKWELKQDLFKDEDSVAVQVFFEGLLNRDVPFCVVARGEGVGKWNGVQTVKDYTSEELNSYPGDPQKTKMDSTFQRLRKSELLIHIDRDICLEINSFTDPVKSNISVSNEDVSQTINKYKLRKNDILSAYRTAAILNKAKSELNVLAGKYLSREDAKIVIDRLNKEIEKAKVSVGPTSLKLELLNE